MKLNLIRALIGAGMLAMSASAHASAFWYFLGTGK
jgi:amino acid permease